MAHRKTYIVQAMDAQGAMLMDLRLDTRAAELLALREGLEGCARNGGGWLRRKTEGAAGWGAYRVENGGKVATMLPAAEKPAVLARFDQWLATGGAA